MPTPDPRRTPPTTATLLHYDYNILKMFWRIIELSVLNSALYLKPMSLLALTTAGASVFFIVKGFTEAGK